MYYSDFNLFNLKGEGVLDSKKSKKSYQSQVVVKYSNEIPTSIEYIYPKRTVSFVLADSITTDRKHVYVYSTDNLFGGKSGKQKDYSLRNVQNKYLVYSSDSDTLLIQSFDAIDARFENYRYEVKVYVKTNGSIKGYYLLSREIKNDKNCTIKKVYESWLFKLRELPSMDSMIILNRLPPCR